MRRGWTRTLIGGLLLCAIAAAGIGLNFTLLRLTSEAHDPVGHLSPRAVFAAETTGTGPAATTPDDTATTPDDAETVHAPDDGSEKGGGENDEV